MRTRTFVLILLLAVSLLSCGKVENPTEMGIGMGMGSGMMERHRAPIPETYKDLRSPRTSAPTAVVTGETVYVSHCTTCHGDGGMGDGPAGQALDPAPAPIAHTSQMMGDDYLFWRISEGGVPFSTAMPAWKDVLTYDEIWDVIHYVRALGKGEVTPRASAGGTVLDPTIQETHQVEMLTQAVEQGLINQIEADIFAKVHTLLDGYLAANPGSGNAEERQADALAALVAAGALTQSQADVFLDVHERLVDAGLMG